MNTRKLMLIPLLMLAPALAQTAYILCEGNFQTPNATLWSWDATQGTVEGPIHWSPNSNPLGDTGQSLTYDDGRLYIVVNNSHKVEVVDVSSGFTPVATLSVPGSSPRYLAVDGSTGYLSVWNLSGILVVNLDTYTVTDTIPLPNAKTEQLLLWNQSLWVAAPMHMDWSVNDQIYRIDLTGEPAVTDSFAVVPGPTSLLRFGTDLYVASTYYDANWNATSGTSRIDLGTGAVLTQEYASSMTFDDLVVWNGEVYRAIPGGVGALNGDLTVDWTRTFTTSGQVYSAATDGQVLLLGRSNYVAPDTVAVLDGNGQLVQELTVGALPGSYAFPAAAMSVRDPLPPLPRTLSISAVYPNPFNPSTTIDFTLRKAGTVVLDVIDVRGRVVATLIRGERAAGAYQINWNPSDLASGQYRLRLTGAGGTSTRSVTYLK